MSRRRGIADEQPSSLGGWLFADLFLLLIVVGFSAFSSDGSDKWPIVETREATAVTGSSAVLNGSVEAKKQKTDVKFEWGTTPTLTDARPVIAVDSPISGAQWNTPIQAELSGLEEGSTYYFRAVASNVSGTARGNILSFKTVIVSPCNPVGAQFLKIPFKRNLTLSGIDDLIDNVKDFAKVHNLTDPRVAVAVIRGWGKSEDGSVGRKNAEGLFRQIRKFDGKQELFYRDTGLVAMENSGLDKKIYSVELFLVDLAKKCEK